jgi:hypothetical protein
MALVMMKTGFCILACMVDLLCRDDGWPLPGVTESPPRPARRFFFCPLSQLADAIRPDRKDEGSAHD